MTGLRDGALRAVARLVFGNLYRRVRLVRRARALHAATSRHAEIAFHLETLRRFEDFWPLQRSSEIGALLGRVRALGPRAVCEIGSAGGGTAFLFTRVAADDAVLVLVDSAFDGARRAALRRFARARQSCA